MKQIITILLLISVISLMFGCVQKQTETKEDIEIDDLEQDIAEIESLDEDLDLSELDSLEKDLDILI